MFERGTIGATIVRSEERPAARPVRESSRWAQPEGPQGATPDARRTRRTSARTPGGPPSTAMFMDFQTKYSQAVVRDSHPPPLGARVDVLSVSGGVPFQERGMVAASRPRAPVRRFPRPPYSADPHARPDRPRVVRGTGDRGSTRGIRAITAGGAARRGARPPGRPGARRGGLRYTRGPVPVRSRPVPGRDANYLLLLLHYYDVNQRRTRVFESNRPSPVFVVVSPRERPMTASRGARARHRIDVPSR